MEGSTKIHTQADPQATSKPIADEIETNWYEVADSFEDLGLREDLLQGIFGYGFEKPSPIQQKAILPVLKRKDTIAQAQSGTGKTGAFTISALQVIDLKNDNCQVIILSPTRELAQQSYQVALSLGEYMKGLKVHRMIGGTSVKLEREALQEGKHIIIGTPGRVLDMMTKGWLKSTNVTLLILDEADNLLDRGFKDDISAVVKLLPSDVQIALFSATMPKEMLDMTKSFMRDPATILVKNDQLTLDGIRQFYIPIAKDEWKFQTLCELYNNLDIQQAMIYCNSKKKVEEIAERMKEQKFTVSFMHGEMEHDQRQLVMKEFRTGCSRVLITTDLLARGIDVQAVNLVINYELPQRTETYIHRIGRSGRYGRKGVAINFISREDSRFIKEVEQFYNTQIEKLPVDLGGLFDF